jgi:hypothetical protein
MFSAYDYICHDETVFMEVKHMKNFLLLFCMVCALSIYAEDIPPEEENSGATVFWRGLARPSDWGRPFWADIHSTLVRAEVAYADNSPEYDWARTGDEYRPFVFANLGADLPLWSGDFSDARFGLRVTLPFMIDVWLDMFEHTTAPVINTGYRFGAEIGFIHRLASPIALVPKWGITIYNYTIKFSPFKHESTHIGDELTIYRKNDGLKITRVNVTYNYSELALTLNDPENVRRINHSFRAGLLILFNFSKGWYDILPQEADTTIVEPSQLPIEFYGQYQFQSNMFGRGLQFIASVELRVRERYKYPFSYSDHLNDLYPEWNDNKNINLCANMFAGIRFNNPHSNYFSKIGIGIHYYTGMNPYGQFRSQMVYNQWGIALIFE